MNPCKVCALDQEHRAAIDEALQNGAPLDKISHGCGIGRSSLHRHFRRHMKANVANGNPENAVSVKTAGTASVPLPPVPAIGMPSVDPRVGRSTKQQLIERIEMLWGEGLDGLAASKEPILVTRPDGSTVELPGDLRARKGFIGELREIVRLQGEATGELIRGQVEANFAIQIVMPIVAPVPPEIGQPRKDPVIDVAVLKHRG